MIGLAAFARDELGVTLTPAQAEMAGSFAAGGFSAAVWQCGRRGGKSLLADVLALGDVALRDHLRVHLRTGEVRVSAIISTRIEAARQHILRCRQLLDHSPSLRAMLVSETADELAFSNGSIIRAYPCSARSIRGDAWSSCVLDELGHFTDTSDGPAAGDRVLESATPALAQFGDAGWVIAISTPRWRQGAFWRLVERAQSGRFPSYHHRHLSTSAMNPAISSVWLAERRREDPDAYAREYEAQFVDGISSYLSSSDVIACVRSTGVLAPGDGRVYAATLDPAYSMDNFAMAVGHAEEGAVVVDGVWVWRRGGHEATLDAVAELARAYGISTLRLDQFCAQPVMEGLSRRGLHGDYRPWTNQNKLEAFSRLKVAVNTRTVELPDDAALIEELCGLETRPTPGGLARIAAVGSGHDDRAVVVAALMDGLTVSRVPSIRAMDDPIWPQPPARGWTRLSETW